MRKLCCPFVCVIVLAATSTVFAQNTKQPEPKSVGEVLSRSLSNLENELVPAAEAMPEDKYSFAPSEGEFKGVRNFGSQLKHLAAVNYVLGAAILGEKPPVDTGGEDGPESAKSKSDIVKFTKDSFAYVRKAAESVTAKNAISSIKSPFGDNSTTRLSLAMVAFGHGFDHYGQIVEYLRMNGIIPPASRQ